MEDVEVLADPDYLWNSIRVATINMDTSLELLNNGDIMSVAERLGLAGAGSRHFMIASGGCQQIPAHTRG